MGDPAEAGAQVWDALSGRELIRLTEAGTPESAALSPDGNWVATATSNGDGKICDLAARKAVNIEGRADRVDPQAFSPDGQRFAGLTAGDDGGYVPVIWDARSGKVVLRIPPKDENPSSVAFSPDGRRIVVAYSYGHARVFDAQSGQAELDLAVSPNVKDALGVKSACFSPDGKEVLTAASTQTPYGPQRSQVQIWDATTGKQLRRIRHKFEELHMAALSPDGSVIATVAPGLALWDAKTGQLRKSMAGHPLNTACFSSDGSLVAGGSPADGAVFIWDVKSGQLLRTLKAGGDQVITVAFRPTHVPR